MQDWIISIVTIAITAAVNTAVAFYVNCMFKKYTKRVDDKKAKEEADAKKAELEGAALKGGVQALLRYNLYEMANHHKKMGYASVYDKNEFENMYNRYHVLGKNGVMDAVYEEFMELPTEKEKRK